MTTKNKNIIIIALIALLVLVGGYFLFFAKKADKEDEDKDKEDKDKEDKDKEDKDKDGKQESEDELKERLEQEEVARRLAEISNKKPPIAKNDLLNARCGRSTKINVITNDKYDGEFSIEISVQPSKGMAEITLDNTIVYTPNEGVKLGADVFKYKITDANGTSNEGSVVVKIECPYCDSRDDASLRFSETTMTDRFLNDQVRQLDAMRNWTREEVSYGAAFLKGIDVMIGVTEFLQYRNRILNFMTACKQKKTKDIVRRTNFLDEIQKQTYQVGELLC